MDFFLRKLLRDIRYWYNEHFDGLDLEERREMHCRFLLVLYDKERFTKADNLENERIKFLGEVQEEVNLEVIRQHIGG